MGSVGEAPAIVFDTCALIWTVNREPMAVKAIEAIRAAVAVGNAIIPSISLWEIPLLERKGRFTVVGSLAVWLDDVLKTAGFRVVPLSGRAALDAATLPGGFHADAADRFIVATARELDAPVVTRDRRILAYGLRGHVRTIRA
jgi:PIN domain nuclease of toxin-antitoxin system